MLPAVDASPEDMLACIIYHPLGLFSNLKKTQETFKKGYRLYFGYRGIIGYAMALGYGHGL